MSPGGREGPRLCRNGTVHTSRRTVKVEDLQRRRSWFGTLTWGGGGKSTSSHEDTLIVRLRYIGSSRLDPSTTRSGTSKHFSTRMCHSITGTPRSGSVPDLRVWWRRFRETWNFRHWVPPCEFFVVRKNKEGSVHSLLGSRSPREVRGLLRLTEDRFYQPTDRHTLTSNLPILGTFVSLWYPLPTVTLTVTPDLILGYESRDRPTVPRETQRNRIGNTGTTWVSVKRMVSISEKVVVVVVGGREWTEVRMLYGSNSTSWNN